MRNKRLEIFDALVNKCPRFDRKGENMIYTSANSHMFALLNKTGEMRFRYSKEVQEQFIKEHNTTIYKSYGAV